MIKEVKGLERGTIHKTVNHGDVQVLKRLDREFYLIRFIDTWYETKTRASQIRSGQIKDLLSPTVEGVGFIGDGMYNTKEHKEAHSKWSKMIERCYSDKFHVGNPTYAGCEVCEEWQDFQNFAEWYYSNKPNSDESYELDKDIKSDGVVGKLYHPDLCTFVTKRENIIDRFSKEFDLISPKGELIRVRNIQQFCRDNGLQQPNLAKVAKGQRRIHKGWTSPNYKA